MTPAAVAFVFGPAMGLALLVDSDDSARFRGASKYAYEDQEGDKDADAELDRDHEGCDGQWGSYDDAADDTPGLVELHACDCVPG